MEARLPNGTRNDTAYVWENATALILTKGASTSTVMNELAGSAKLVSGYSWTQSLWEGRNVLVIEPTNGGSAERIADLHKRGLVQGTGRVAFFDKAGRNVTVIPNRFLIDASDSTREPELAAEAARHGFKLEVRYGGYELVPLEGTQDALEVARRAEQFAKSPLVRPNSLRPDWMSPLDVRQPRQ